MNNVNLRITHPNLYYLVMAFGFTYIALGLNFFFTMPTFNPYGIPYPIVGALFLTLGVAKLVFLNVVRRLTVVRLLMALEVALALWWGIGASITFFQGRTSLQLPILYAGLSFIEAFLLLEPFVNPLTKKAGK